MRQRPSTGSPLLVEQRDDVRWIWLNRPERRNALNPSLVAALSSAVRDADDSPDTAVVVLSGRGASFCAGADLRYLRDLAATGSDPLAFLADVSRCFRRIEQVAKPVVAAVHGHVVAGGLELALVCDTVVARAGTLIGDGHVRNGLLPAAGSSVRLSRRVGEPLARWLMLTGALLPAEAFTASGFVRAVPPEDMFDAAVADTVDQLRRAAGPAQARLKRLLDELAGLATDPALDRELATFAHHWNDSDMTTALDSFLRPGKAE
jgi:enoyl-CoA hydratase/carnithine racemase